MPVVVDLVLPEHGEGMAGTDFSLAPAHSVDPVRSRRTVCAAMCVPVALLPVLWAGVIGSVSFMVGAHVLMLAACCPTTKRPSGRGPS